MRCFRDPAVPASPIHLSRSMILALCGERIEHWDRLPEETWDSMTETFCAECCRLRQEIHMTGLAG